MTEAKMIRAVLIHEFGGPEVIEDGLVVRPAPVEGEILIAIEAAPVNPADVFRRQGRFPRALPLGLGRDFAGTVKAVGAGVTRFAIGDAVYGYHGNRASNGANAEAICLPAALCALRPASLDAAQSAALVVPGMTAMRCADRSGIQAGGSAFVGGAAGSVGHALVQILRSRRVGRIVYGTSSAAGADYLAKELGVPTRDIAKAQSADRLTTDALAANDGRLFDVAFDLRGGETKLACLNLAAAGGTVVSVVEEPADFPVAIWDERSSVLTAKSLALVFEQLGSIATHGTLADLERYGELLGEITRLADTGALRPPPLTILRPICAATARQAHRMIEAGVASKMVLAAD